MLEPTFDRSYAKDLLPSKLDNYMKEFDADVSLNEVNIHEKAMLRASIAAKWCRYEYEEKKLKDKMSEAVDKLKADAKKALFEKKRSLIESKMMNESMINIEAEKIIKQSSAYLKIKGSLAAQEEILRFIAEAKQIVAQFGFDLKNAIEVLKLES